VKGYLRRKCRRSQSSREGNEFDASEISAELHLMSFSVLGMFGQLLREGDRLMPPKKPQLKKEIN
jgi:hypothetical protein